MALLTEQQLSERLATLPGWSRTGDAIEKTFAFASFPDAIAFLVRLAFDAEGADHHPDVKVSFRRLTIGYSTHSEGGVTEKDIDGARTAELLFEATRPGGASA